MSKIILGKRPATFKRNVKFPMLDGTTGSIDITFKYRTRRDFGKFIDELMAAAGDSKPLDDVKFSMAELMTKTAGSNASYVLAVVDAWSLDEPLNNEKVEQLSDELPSAINAIMEVYRIAITEGRITN